LTQRVFDKSPDLHDAFYKAGVALDDTKKFVVANTETKHKLLGNDALRYIRDSRALQSLMINVAQGEFLGDSGASKDKGTDAAKVDPKQAVLDANFETFKAHALAGIPGGILNGPTDTAALAAHSIHGAPGFFNWSDWSTFGTSSLANMALHIWERGGDAWYAAIVPQSWRSLLPGWDEGAHTRKVPAPVPPK
jgi:hypothetical protein